MPRSGPAAASFMAAFTFSSVAGFSSSTVRSTSETFGVGTRTAMPSSLPFSAGSTRPMARAAPVLLGIMESAAARARRGASRGGALGEHADRLPGDGEPVLVGAHVAREGPMDGVVLEQVREGLRVGDVVHGDELEHALVEAGAEHVPPDAAEAIDADADRHGSSLLVRGRAPACELRAACAGEFLFHGRVGWSRRSGPAN